MVRKFRKAVHEMMHGNMKVEVAVQLLREQNLRGVTVDEVLAVIDEISCSYERKYPVPRQAINIVGTGRVPGMQKSVYGRFSGISSATAIVLSSMGMRVIKHGGLGHDGSGSANFFANVFESYAQCVESPERHEALIGNASLAFAGVMAFPHLSEIRSQLNEGSIFNIAFPFAAPFTGHESMRFIGVSGDESHFELVSKVAERYLSSAKSEMAIVVYQGYGDDASGERFGEVSPFGSTFFCTVTRHGIGLHRSFDASSCWRTNITRRDFAGNRSLPARDFMHIIAQDVRSWSNHDTMLAHIIAINAAFVRLRYVEYREHTFMQYSYACAQYDDALKAIGGRRVQHFLFPEEAEKVEEAEA